MLQLDSIGLIGLFKCLQLWFSTQIPACGVTCMQGFINLTTMKKKKGIIHVTKSVKAGDYEHMAINANNVYGISYERIKEDENLFQFINAAVRSDLDRWDIANPTSTNSMVFGMLVVVIETPNGELDLQAYKDQQMAIEFVTERGTRVVEISKIVVCNPNIVSKENDMMLDLINKYTKAAEDLKKL